MFQTRVRARLAHFVAIVDGPKKERTLYFSASTIYRRIVLSAPARAGAPSVQALDFCEKLLQGERSTIRMCRLL
jgi:hypothetical protein